MGPQGGDFLNEKPLAKTGLIPNAARSVTPAVTTPAQGVTPELPGHAAEGEHEESILREFLSVDPFWPALEKDRKKIERKLTQIVQLVKLRDGGEKLQVNQESKIGERELLEGNLRQVGESLREIEADYREQTRAQIELQEKRSCQTYSLSAAQMTADKNAMTARQKARARQKQAGGGN